MAILGGERVSQYLTIQQAQGHHHGTQVYEDQATKNGGQFNVVATFLKNITPLIQSLDMVFEAAAPTPYHQYLRVFHHQLFQTSLNVFHTTRQACFMGLAISRNNRVMPHKDVTDFRDGWEVMCCLGQFRGGELCL